MRRLALFASGWCLAALLAGPALAQFTPTMGAPGGGSVVGGARQAGPLTTLVFQDILLTPGRYASPVAADTGQSVAVAGDPKLCPGGGSYTWTAANTLCVAGAPDGGALGALIEAAGSSLAKMPNNFNNAAWTKQHSPSVTADQAVAPDGTTTMDLIDTTPGADLNNWVYEHITVSGTTFTGSAWIRPFAGGDYESLVIELAGTGGIASCTCTRDSGASCTAAIAGSDCNVKSTFSGLDRMTITVVSNLAQSAVNFVAFPGQAGSVTGKGYYWGAQLELEPVASSTIASPDGGQGSRIADVLSLTTPLDLTGPWCMGGTVVPYAGRAYSTGAAALLSAGSSHTGANSVEISLDTSKNLVGAVYDGSAAVKTATYSLGAGTPAVLVCDSAGTLSAGVSGSKVTPTVTGAGTGALGSNPATMYLGSLAGGGTAWTGGYLSNIVACTGALGCPALFASNWWTPQSAPPSTGLVYAFDGSNIDGSNDATLTTGDAISTWHDLGSGGDATPLSTYSPALYEAAIVGGHPAANFAGTVQNVVVDGGAASSAFIHSTAVFDIYALFRSNRWQAGSTPLQTTESLLQNSTASDTGFALGFDSTGHPVFEINHGPDGGPALFSYTTVYGQPAFVWQMLEAKGDGSTISLSRDLKTFEGAAIVGSLPVGNAYDKLAIGGYGLAGGNVSDIYYWDGDIQEVLVYDHVLSDADRAQVRGFFASRNGPQDSPAAGARQIACLGDSITYFGSATTARPYPQVLQGLLDAAHPGVHSVANFGKRSDKLAQMLTRYNGGIAGKGYTDLVLLGGINNIDAGETAASIEPTAQTILDDARTRGMHLTVLTVTPYGLESPGWTAGEQTQLDLYNTWLRNYVSTYPSAATLVDTYALMGDPITPVNLLAAYAYSDGLHWSQAGCDFAAAQVKTALGL